MRGCLETLLIGRLPDFLKKKYYGDRLQNVWVPDTSHVWPYGLGYNPDGSKVGTVLKEEYCSADCQKRDDCPLRKVVIHIVNEGPVINTEMGHEVGQAFLQGHVTLDSTDGKKNRMVLSCLTHEGTGRIKSQGPWLDLR